MMSRNWIVSIIGFAGAWLVAQSSAAAVWSVEADCEEGDWAVEIELAGVGPIDASCLDGTKTKLRFDVEGPAVPTARVAATSAFGTSCDAVADGEPRLKLACSEKTEDIDGFEQEEEIEVELELEEIEEEDEEE